MQQAGHVRTQQHSSPDDEALVRSVQCSKQARKALARGDVPVAWLDVTGVDDAVAARLAPLLAGRRAARTTTTRSRRTTPGRAGVRRAPSRATASTRRTTSSRKPRFAAVARRLNLNAAGGLRLGCSAALTMAVAVATDARLAHGTSS